MNDTSFDDSVTDAVKMCRSHPGVEHLWLNRFACITPTDDFAASVGHSVIRKVMESKGRHVVLRVNVS